MTSPKVLAAGLSAAALVAFAGVAAAEPVAPSPEHNCFYITEWKGWKAPDANTLYLRVNLHDIYKVGLSAGSEQLKWPGNHLVSQVRGSSSICSALDLDLAVSDGHGFKTPIIATTLIKLTPEQIAAIPKKDLP